MVQCCGHLANHSWMSWIQLDERNFCVGFFDKHPIFHPSSGRWFSGIVLLPICTCVFFQVHTNLFGFLLVAYCLEPLCSMDHCKVRVVRLASKRRHMIVHFIPWAWLKPVSPNVRSIYLSLHVASVKYYQSYLPSLAWGQVAYAVKVMVMSCAYRDLYHVCWLDMLNEMYLKLLPL